jgi:hypothetical protein
MKKTILFLSILTLTACGDDRPPSVHYEDQKIRELGTCSSTLITELYIAEMKFNLYKEKGLSYGQGLVNTHADYLSIQKRYGDVSCDTVDRRTGEIIKITNADIQKFIDAVYSEIRTAFEVKCPNSYSSLTVQEKAGCSHIKMYLKPNNGSSDSI